MTPPSSSPPFRRCPASFVASPYAVSSNNFDVSSCAAAAAVAPRSTTSRRLFSKPTSPCTLSPQSNPLRRRRLALWTAQAQQPDSSGTGGEQPSGADNDEASDLTLPYLPNLFTEGGDPSCDQCRGEGEIKCPVCDGTGFFSLTMMDTTSATTCRMCKGRRKVPCPSCRSHLFKSIVWWDQIPSEEDDPDEKWQQGPSGEPRIPWGGPPNES